MIIEKTALITGASGGIGRALARRLAESIPTGGRLLLHGNANRDSLHALVDELAAQYPESQFHALFADLSQTSGQDRLIAEASAICPAPDILVMAAGLDLMTAAMKALPFEERFARLWQVDVAGTMRIARCFGNRLQQTRHDRSSIGNRAAPLPGAIVLFGWDGVEYGMAGETAQLYAAAKGAVQGFSRSLARSLAPDVRVNCVAPGWIKTTWGETASPAINELVTAESSAQRWGTPQEVAELVCFLVSDAAAYINNQTIFVNGGKIY